ncbi:hypothetical protein CTAYLR_004965 [Chrysophaeum taylorii]|uniref:HTH OST-type domain-containing protein n=1 Tax=Chrysophaeum taylorii TaxID=2483200 RepID=A0AAD7URW1_9STRA|nr:hypothetical protein CTAYLR_004965 [Chrysophaeum taylorii]
MGAGQSIDDASRIDAASLHALAVQTRKPALVCQLVSDNDIDGLTALELDESSVSELVSSKLDQKKVLAALKHFRQAQQQQQLDSGTEPSSSSNLAQRVSELEHEVWELRSCVEDVRSRNAPRPAPKKAEPDASLNLEERVKILEDEILALCDAAPQGSMLAANLPRLYYYRYGRNLDFRSLGFLKLSQLLAKMSRIEFDGNHRALVSKKELPVFSPTFPAAEEDLLPSYLLRESPFMQ